MYRILVISDYRPFHTTRPEASIFIRLAELGHQLFIMAPKPNDFDEKFKEAGITTIDWHPENKFDKAEWLKISNFVRENDIQFVHAYTSKSSVTANNALKGLNVYLILYRGFSNHINFWRPENYIKHLHPRPDAIICNSQGVGKAIRKALLWRSYKAVVVNKGHNIDWYADVPKINLHKTVNLDPETLLLITVANNRKMKGMVYLLKAMADLPSDKKIALLLLGNGLDTEENRAIVESIPANSDVSVRFMGFQTNVLEWVKAADCFVLPSIYGESITKSVIEAMSLETPAILTDIAGNTELHQDKTVGWVVPPKNSEALKRAILHISEHREALAPEGKKSKALVADKLTTKKTVQGYLNIYDYLTENGSLKGYAKAKKLKG